MKKITALIMAMLIVLSCAVPALAFTDVNDADTATAAEVLRLMGVIDGYPDGTFKPNNTLKRSEFCKMAVYALGEQDSVGGYKTSTIFPDVKPSDWFAQYVNMSAKKGMITGFPEGTFKPSDEVTVGQAVAILLRAILGSEFKVADFPQWPFSYMTEASAKGILDNTGIGVNDGNRTIKRGEAAKLFVSALKNGLGDYTPASGTISSIDAGTGIVTISGGGELEMANSFKNTTLIGSKGTILTNAKKEFVTVIPENSNGAGLTNAVVIVAQNGSTNGFAQLSGGNTYRIFKNGVEIPASEIKKGDVATYSSNTRTINLCDTRVRVYYESCDPSPSNPSTITILDGTEFSVIESARNDLAKYTPGDEITVMFTANGQIAGVTDLSPKNMALVGGAISTDKDGNPVITSNINLFCGNNLIATNAVAPDHIGRLVSVTSYTVPARTSSEPYKITVSEYTNTTYNFDPVRRLVGDYKLSDNVRIYRSGRPIASSELGNGIILADDISYARHDANDNIDLIIIPGTQTTTIVYGKARYDSETRELTISNSTVAKAYPTTYEVKSGDYVSAKIISRYMGTKRYPNEEGGTNVSYTTVTVFADVETLGQLKNVKKTAFSGKSMVTFGGKSYVIPDDVQCYNKDSQSWVTLDQALAYSDTYTCYNSDDGIIRIIEVAR